MASRNSSRVAWLVVVLAVGIAAAAQDSVSDSAPASTSIREQDLRGDLSFIASDLLQGRLTGTVGNQLATEFIRARFERLGLKPIGPGASYFQPYMLMTATLGTSNAIEVRAAGQTLRAKADQDLYPHRFSPDARATGSLVFAGFGVVAPERGYDDYRGANVRGRIVLVLDHEPGEREANSPLDRLVSSEAASPLQKTLEAQAHGAVGILFVSDVHNHVVDRGSFTSQAAEAWPRVAPRIERYMLATWVERVRIPAMQISTELASTMLHATGKSLTELARESESRTGRTVLSVDNVRVEMVTSVTRRLIPDRNVVAALDGSDARVRDEWVILGAHLDHDGADGTTTFSGADDNGSGVAGLLEIAEAYAQAAEMERRPRRSVLFAAWNSEERGLFGAWAYTEQPLVPLDRTVAVLNMDMIGRNEEVPSGGGYRFQGLEPQSAHSNENAVNLLGYSYTPELGDEAMRANSAIGLQLNRRYDNTSANLLRRSDQWPFLRRGVPAIWFFTGLHPDYHTPGDRADKINYPKLARVVRLVYQTSWAVAQRDGRPKLVQPAIR